MIRRGQIWWYDFGEPRGSEPAFRRPVLVLQRNEVNRSAIGTAIVCVLTSTVELEHARGNVLLRRRATGLPYDSVVNASQIATVDKSWLEDQVGSLPAPALQQVEDGIRWMLALER